MAHTQTEWIATKIEDGYAIKEKSLPNGFCDRIAELYQYDAESNAKLIVAAVNNFKPLVESLKALIDTSFTNSANTVEVGKKEMRELKQLLQQIEKENIL